MFGIMIDLTFSVFSQNLSDECMIGSVAGYKNCIIIPKLMNRQVQLPKQDKCQLVLVYFIIYIVARDFAYDNLGTLG